MIRVMDYCSATGSPPGILVTGSVCRDVDRTWVRRHGDIIFCRILINGQVVHKSLALTLSGVWCADCCGSCVVGSFSPLVHRFYGREFADSFPFWACFPHSCRNLLASGLPENSNREIKVAHSTRCRSLRVGYRQHSAAENARSLHAPQDWLFANPPAWSG